MSMLADAFLGTETRKPASSATPQDVLGRSLDEFIEFLEKNYPDEVIRVTNEVDPIFQATAALWRLARSPAWRS